MHAQSPFHILCKPVGPKCNLNCRYCFYLSKDALFPDKKSVREFTMPDDVLEEFVRQYIEAQHPSAPEVNFAWQGGEPTLLGIDFFARAVEYQKKYARSHQRITNAFQTNGTLLNDEWGKFLHDNRFLVGLSVDGPQELHDHFRKDWAGKGSFERVMRGLEVLKRHQVEFNTLTTVQRYNADHPQEVYRFLRRIGSTFMQFIPIVEPAPDGAEGASEESVQPEQWGKFLCGVFDEWRKRDIGKVYVQHFELMVSLAMGYPASLCVHSRICGRSVAIEHNGNLYSCDHFVNPEDLLGNIMQTHVREMVDGKKQTQFGLNKSATLPRQCRECKYLTWCYGGCPADRVKRDKYGEPGLNYVCEGYYRFYDYTKPYFDAIAAAIHHQRPASDYQYFMNKKPTSPPAMLPGSMPAGSGKIGRNQSCPCGSGRKYKNCCGRRR
ncbi:MAG: anaerobic sulfatase maturase [Lentisphaerae bacterium]|nr:MAG: anaerobic sulfatase maturase [Lentisphaerota bacterium]